MSIDDRDYYRNRRNVINKNYIYNPKEFRRGRSTISNNTIEEPVKKKNTEITLLKVLVWIGVALIVFKLFQYIESNTINNRNFSISTPTEINSIKQNIPENSVTSIPSKTTPDRSAPQITNSFSNNTNTASERYIATKKNSNNIYKCVNAGKISYGSVPCAYNAESHEIKR